MALEDVGVNLVVKGQQAFSSALSIATKAVVGIGVAAAGAAIGIGKMVLDSATLADKFATLSGVTGMSTDALQEYDFIGKKLDVDLETITGSMTRMVRSMGSAQDGSKNIADAYAQLGVKVTDSNGKLRDSQVVYKEVLVALGKMKNPTEQDAIAMQIFGRSAMELNPLIRAGTEKLDELTKAAHDTGAVMSADAIEGLDQFKDTLDSLGNSMKGNLGTLAGAFIPGLKVLGAKATEYMTQFATVIKDSKGDIGKAATGIGQLFGKILTDLTANLPQLMQAGINILQGIVNAIITALPVLLPAMVQVVNSLLTFLIQNIPLLISAGMQILLAVTDGIMKSLPTLMTAGTQVILQIITSLAENFPLLVSNAVGIIVALANGIAKALPQIIPAVVAIIPQIITTLIQNLPLLITAALQIIMALAQGLIASLPTLIAAIPQIVITLVKTLIELAPQLLQSAYELIRMLVKGIVNMLPKIGEAAGQVIETLVGGLGKLASSLWEAGKKIVEGVWNGISNAASWFRSQVEGFFKGIVDGVKRLLGIKSPSKVFGKIGQNMALGLGMGFEKSFQQIEARVGQAVNGLAAQASMAVMPGIAGRGTVSAGPTTNNYSTSYNLQVMTNQSPQVVSQSFSIMRMLAG